MDRLGPANFSALQMKGHVLHDCARAHLKILGCSTAHTHDAKHVSFATLRNCLFTVSNAHYQPIDKTKWFCNTPTNAAQQFL